MSHFAVAVFTKPNGETVDELLAPYYEGLEVESYIYKTKGELIAEGKEFQESVKDGKRTLSKYNKDIVNAKTDEELYNAICEYHGYKPDDNGNIWSTYNPNSKWDWYSIGGRFPGRLKSKNGSHGEGSAFNDNPMIDGEFDSARVGDIDFSPDMDKYNKAIRFWEVVVDKEPLKEGENEDDFFNLYREEWYKEYYKNKIIYAQICASCSTYAVVTPDGKWHQKGDMLWFGMSTETEDEALDWDIHYKERFIDTADPDWNLTIVDCHI